MKFDYNLDKLSEEELESILKEDFDDADVDYIIAAAAALCAKDDKITDDEMHAAWQRFVDRCLS